MWLSKEEDNHSNVKRPTPSGSRMYGGGGGGVEHREVVRGFRATLCQLERKKPWKPTQLSNYQISMSDFSHVNYRHHRLVTIIYYMLVQ